MNRRLWAVVALVATLFGGLSLAANPAALEAVVSTLGRVGTLLADLSWSTITAIAAGALALTGLVWVLERKRRGGNPAPWQQIIALGKAGRPISVIARQTGVAQDVVRIVLAPVAIDSSVPRGKSFRADPGNGGIEEPPSRRRKSS